VRAALTHRWEPRIRGDIPAQRLTIGAVQESQTILAGSCSVPPRACPFIVSHSIVSMSDVCFA
jgi:hypothetical protein